MQPSDAVLSICDDIWKQSCSMVEENGGVVPAAFVLLSQKVGFVVPATLGNPGMKSAFWRALSSFADAVDADAVVVVTEAWMVQAMADEVLDVPPSQHPDRFDALHMTLTLPDGSSHAWFAKKKMEGDKAVLTDKTCSMDGGGIGAVMTMIPPWGKHARRH